jgi:hypothetical protein
MVKGNCLWDNKDANRTAAKMMSKSKGVFDRDYRSA